MYVISATQSLVDASYNHAGDQVGIYRQAVIGIRCSHKSLANPRLQAVFAHHATDLLPVIPMSLPAEQIGLNRS